MKKILKIYKNFKTKTNRSLDEIFSKNTNWTRVLGVLCLCLFIFSFIYDYISDLRYNFKTLLAIYIVVSFTIFFLLFILLEKIHKKIKNLNSNFLVFEILIIFGIYKIISACPDDFSDLQLLGLAFLLSLPFLFAYIGLRLLAGRKKVGYLFLFPNVLIISILLFFLFKDSFGARKDFSFDVKRGPYQVIFKDYESVKKTLDLRPYIKYSSSFKPKTARKLRDLINADKLSNAKLRGRIAYPKNLDKKDLKTAPLFVLVHGNHQMTTDSYRGYDYLLDYLASKGMIAVSVDEKVLNGFYEISLSDEMGARALMLLENIKYLVENPEGLDIPSISNDNAIYLAGHSRGAEAIMTAYNLNDLNKFPNKGSKNLDFKFNIRGLISIAGTHNQYDLGGKEILASNTDLLFVHGSHDRDLEDFEGLRAYKYSSLGPENFKAAVYLRGASHGMFNQLWQEKDQDYPEKFFIDGDGLLKRRTQENILKSLIFDFIDSSRHGRGENFGKKLLKTLDSTKAFCQFQKGPSKIINDYEEDYDIETASIGGRNKFKGFSSYYEFEKEDLGSGLYLESTASSSYETYLKNPIEFKELSLVIENLSLDGIEASLEVSDIYGESARLDLPDIKGPEKFYRSKIAYLKDDYDLKSIPISLSFSFEDFQRKNPLLKDEIRYVNLILHVGEIFLDDMAYKN